MIWEIYAYWNIQELRGVFEAIAMLTSSSDYLTLLSSIIIFGLLAVSLAALAGTIDQMQTWRWLAMVIILYFVMFVPKTDVALVDRTGTMPATVVHNVPFSIAVFGHLTSKLGDWLTTSYETTMSFISTDYDNTGVKFVGNGLLFGQKLLLEANTMSMQNKVLNANLNSFMDKCVMPEIDTGHISIYKLVNSNNIWSDVSNVNPALYLTLLDSNGVPDSSPTSCTIAYNSLTQSLNNTANSEANRLAKKLYPDEAEPIARSHLNAAYTGTYGYMLGVSNTAVEGLRQRFAANSLLNTAGMSDVDIYAMSQAETIARQQYSTLSQIAQTTIPKLRNVIEVVIYVLFPIVLIMIIIGGSKGLIVIKSYAIGLLWIQLWSPLYAVMNYLMTSFRQKEFIATIHPDSALSILNANLINSGATSDMNIAGMLAMSIPMIAYAVIKGGEMAMTQFVAGTTAPAQMAAMRSAHDVSQGNLSYGNVSANTASYDNISAFSHSMKPTADYGALTMTDRSNVQATSTERGHVFYDTSGAENKGSAYSYTMATQQVEQSASEYSNAVKASRQATFEAGLNTAVNWSHIVGTDSQYDIKSGLEASQTVGDKESASQGLSKIQQLQQQLKNSGQFTDAQVNKLTAWAQTAVAVGVDLKGLKAGWSGEAGLKFDTSQETKAAKIFEEAASSLTQHEAQEAIQFQKEVGSNQNVRNAMGMSDIVSDKYQGQYTTQATLDEKESSALAREKQALDKFTTAKAKQEQESINLWAATPINAHSPAFQNWLKTDGKNDLLELNSAIKQGDENKAAAISARINSQYQSLGSSFASMSSYIAGVHNPDLGLKGSAKDVHNFRHSNDSTIAPTYVKFNHATGAGHLFSEVEEISKSRSEALHTGQTNTLQNIKWTQDLNQFKSDSYKEDTKWHPPLAKPKDNVNVPISEVTDRLNKEVYMPSGLEILSTGIKTHNAIKNKLKKDD